MQNYLVNWDNRKNKFLALKFCYTVHNELYECSYGHTHIHIHTLSTLICLYKHSYITFLTISSLQSPRLEIPTTYVITTILPRNQPNYKLPPLFGCLQYWQLSQATIIVILNTKLSTWLMHTTVITTKQLIIQWVLIEEPQLAQGSILYGYN